MADFEINQLCKKAGNLALMLRGSKSTYECRTFKPGHPVDESDNSDMAPQAFDGPATTDSGRTTVTYTLFGALVKIRPLPSKTEYILEKGHVTCNR
jgi:hypothetical protein